MTSLHPPKVTSKATSPSERASAQRSSVTPHAPQHAAGSLASRGAAAAYAALVPERRASTALCARGAMARRGGAARQPGEPRDETASRAARALAPAHARAQARAPALGRSRALGALRWHRRRRRRHVVCGRVPRRPCERTVPTSCRQRVQRACDPDGTARSGASDQGPGGIQRRPALRVGNLARCDERLHLLAAAAAAAALTARRAREQLHEHVERDPAPARAPVSRARPPCGLGGGRRCLSFDGGHPLGRGLSL